MAARKNLTQHWKRDALPNISDWETKSEEYTVMAKLTAYIQQENSSQFKKEWLTYIMQEGKYNYLEYDF